MKNKSKKGIIHLLPLVLIGVLVVGGIYVFNNGNLTLTKNKKESSQSTPLQNLSDFQAYLEENCKEDERGEKRISIEHLPLEINNIAINAPNDEDSKDGYRCSQWYGQGGLYVNVPYINKYRTGDSGSLKSSFAIYNDSARITGLEGGYIGLGTFKTVVHEKDDYNVSIDFGWPHAGPPQIGNIGLVGVIEKKLVSNGVTIYINTYETLIDGNDPRLTQIQKKYSEYETVIQGSTSEEVEIQIVDFKQSDKALEEIRKTYFLEPNNNEREWQVINGLMEQMEGFSAK